jgi:pimeloyl-ACP methyl ester carboxylesterase
VERQRAGSELALNAAGVADLVEQGAGAAPRGTVSKEEMGRLYRVEHRVPVGPGRSLHVTETFTRASFRRPGPRRAMVMLPGPGARGDLFHVDVCGYDGGTLLAERGFFAYAVDFEGSGASTRPASGRDVTLSSQVAAVNEVVRYVQLTRGVPRVDLLGESWGGGVAAEVGRDASLVRSVILASTIYEAPSPKAAAEAQGPGFRAFLDAQSDGYLEIPPPFYEAIAAGSPPEVAAWLRTTQPGKFPVGPFLEFFSLPYFDPREVAVPVLLVQGADDPQALPADLDELAAAVGRYGAARIARIEGGGHIPRLGGAPQRAAFWHAVTDFVDPAG